MNFDQATAHAVQLLHKLSPKLTYHDFAHTVSDVVPAVKMLAEAESLSEYDQILLVTAAYYHDVGFLELRQGHELVSARIAGESLPHFGYSRAEIECIQDLIMATRLPTHPQTLMQKLIADADLDSLGRTDFWSRSMALRAEMATQQIFFTDAEWYANQIAFLSSHRYWSESARRLRDEQKALNLADMTARLHAEVG
jgi:uncharacterized protein